MYSCIDCQQQTSLVSWAMQAFTKAFARRQLQSTDKSLVEDLVQAVFVVLTGQGIECNVTDLTYRTVGDTTTVCYKTKGDEDADDAYDIESSASFPALLANAMSELGRSGSEYSVEATYLTTEALVNDPPLPPQRPPPLLPPPLPSPPPPQTPPPPSPPSFPPPDITLTLRVARTTLCRRRV